MGCRSDYMEPTHKERLLQETAQLYEYALFEMNQIVPADVKAAAKDIYCRKDFVPDLCELVTNMNDLQRQRVVYNPYHKMSRKLADWWEKHQEADRRRIEQEQIESIRQEIALSALSKLTDAEKKALGLG